MTPSEIDAFLEKQQAAKEAKERAAAVAAGFIEEDSDADADAAEGS